MVSLVVFSNGWCFWRGFVKLTLTVFLASVLPTRPTAAAPYPLLCPFPTSPPPAPLVPPTLHAPLVPPALHPGIHLPPSSPLVPPTLPALCPFPRLHSQPICSSYQHHLFRISFMFL
ncbi:hypothetical protein Pcinc_042082 [Petrolisthes cinctipes]|uniref:Uncharacterized protein n=1 Tax=Petrolisthes cinctipes TaxID=88211 RepID=A0AAE1BIA9_PETCI|nr:hypothetical protein Pcinc_042082 [Petrolisthes cinctipes]